MATDPISGNSSNVALQPKGNGDPFSNVKLDDFLKLMITEMQNQDPLNPMDNSQILQQIGQMQSIYSSNKLTDTLGSVALGNTITSASSMLWRTITGLDDKGNAVSGVVERVSVENGEAKLQIGDDTIVSLKNVRTIEPAIIDE